MTRCPLCARAIAKSDQRYETNGHGETPFLEHGCRHCLRGRNVYLYPEHAQWLRSEADERRISSMREGVDL